MKNKIKIKNVALILCAVLVAAGSVGAWLALREGDGGGTTLGTPESYLYCYSTVPVDYDLVQIDTETDIMAYAPYLECNRDFNYTTNNYTVSFTLEEASERVDDVGFFARYFLSVRDADHKTHAALFSDLEFYENSMPARFSRQMVHDIEVEYLGELNDAAYYCVTTAILESDGTYLKNLADGGTRSLWFEVVKINGEMKIRAIYNSSLAIIALAQGQ